MLVRFVPKFNIFEPFLWVFYVWYYFPIARTFFRSALYNQMFFAIFGCGCLLCVIELLCMRFKIELKFTPLIPVLAYMAVFTALAAFGIGDAGRHVRISFMFWGTLIVFFLSGYYPHARRRLIKLLFVLFLVTVVTSLLGVIANPSAARILTYAANDIEEDLALRMLNIGGIAFFQGLVICIPILVSFIFEKKYVVFSIVMIIVVFIGLMAASFTISLLLFFIALIMSYLFNNNSIKRAIILLLVIAVIVFIPWDRLFYAIANSIENDTVAQRFESIASSLSNNALVGNLKSRVDLYLSSFKVFLNNPLGVGPQYSYVPRFNGIGYHSQLLDDLARYGLFGLAFYVLFFIAYYLLVKKQWEKVGMPQIAIPVVVLYVLFLTFNLGFTSAHESVLMLLLIPGLPEIILQKPSGGFVLKKR